MKKYLGTSHLSCLMSKLIFNAAITSRIIVIFCLIFSFSCAKEKEDNTAESTYIEAMQKIKDKDYIAAAEDFEKISDEYPLSKWGIKAQIMAAYSFYKEEKYDDAIRVAESFNSNNPSSPYVDYMQYLKSISYYNQINDIERAQDNASAASYSFRELIARFPESKYAEDGREKLNLVDEHIAGAKMSVGRYQLQNQNYVGAIKNFQEVLNKYSGTEQAPEAYFRLFEVYKTIGLNQQARVYSVQLKKLYPNNIWSKSIK